MNTPKATPASTPKAKVTRSRTATQMLAAMDSEAGTIGVKDLTSGDQVSVPTDSVVAEVLSKLVR